MHAVLLDDFREWLDRRGLELHRVPFGDEPDLAAYVVTPSEALMQAGVGPHPHNAPEQWRDDGKCIWKSCPVHRTVG